MGGWNSARINQRLPVLSADLHSRKIFLEDLIAIGLRAVCSEIEALFPSLAAMCCTRDIENSAMEIPLLTGDP